MQTLTVREAETQLQHLVKQAQTTHRPVILTSEETLEPVAVLLEPEQYAAVAIDPTLILSTRIGKLEKLLELLAAQWERSAVRQAFPGAWQWHLEGVWQASRHRERPFRQLVVLLQMAGQDLKMAAFTQEHLALWRKCLNTLRQPQVSLASLIECDTALSQQGFPVLLALEEDMIDLYVAES